jgi:transposase
MIGKCSNDDAKGVEYRRIDVLTGPGKRQRWLDDDKARIIAWPAQPGAVVADVAWSWQVTPQPVFDWRRPAHKALAAATALAEPPTVPIVAEALAQWLPEPPAVAFPRHARDRGQACGRSIPRRARHRR